MSTSALRETAGWPVLHLFFRVNRTRWRAVPADQRRTATEEFTKLISTVAAEEGLQLVTIAGIAKFDVGFMLVHPEVSRVQQFGQELAATVLGSCLDPEYSFFSMSEVSEYMSTPGEWAQKLIDEQGMDPSSADFAASVGSFGKRMAAYAEARVHPQLPPDLPVVCFYPMSKMRVAEQNWYTLDFAERKKLMIGHGETGRRFAGRVLQLITSCTGLDDWEWGVTLFGRDLKSIRDVVYEMRFDLASAIYAEFGEFYVGLRTTPEELNETLKL